MGADRFTGHRRIVRLVVLRSPSHAPLVGAFSRKAWASHASGHRHTRGLFCRLPGGRLLRLLLRTLTTTDAQLHRLGLWCPPLPPPLPLSHW
jgi:hypothetical protein